MSATVLRHRLRRPSSDLVSRAEPGVVHVSGVVDATTVPVFASVLATCEEDPCIQALDLSAVEFFCSAGVWCFVDRGWPIRPHVSIIASRAVRRVLTICDMDFLLERHGWRAACA